MSFDGRSRAAAEEIPQQDLYVDNPRDDVISHVPTTGVRSALDVGCGRGGFGRSLRGALGADAYIAGVEPVIQQAEAASRDHGFDEVAQGYFPQALSHLSRQTFDLITFNDVLEHLVDPWSALKEARNHLSDRGTVVAAIPNIQYAPVVWQLIRGRWNYEDAGTLDRTHLRFFTKSSMVDLFEDSGYRVVSCTGTNSLKARWDTDPVAPRRFAKALWAQALGDAAFLHFVLVATPAAV